MDRRAALSQVESGDNDLAVGAAGEVPDIRSDLKIWERYARPDMDWQKATDALIAAREDHS